MVNFGGRFIDSESYTTVKNPIWLLRFWLHLVEKMKWANVTKLQNDKKTSKITPFLGNFIKITANFSEKIIVFSSTSLF